MIATLNDVRLENLLYTDLPKRVRNEFERRSSMFIEDLETYYKENDFNVLKKITFPNKDITYVAQKLKQYDAENKELLFYLYEENNTKEKIGHGEVRFNKWENDFFHDKPFVGYTFTEESFTRQGYGFRRLLTMNHLTQSEYGLPLYSASTHSHPSAKNIWKKAVDFGIAKKIMHNKEERYQLCLF